MIPRVGESLQAVVPSEWVPWIPDTEMLDADEGFGYFRDTWIIGGVSKEYASEVVQNEMRAIQYLDETANSAVEFDAYARYAESYEQVDDHEGHDIAEQGAELFGQHCDLDLIAATGLELGVAGLVLSLASGPWWPAASCRGHPDGQAWALHPVVYFATDRANIDSLSSPIAKAGCGLGLDPNRGNSLLTLLGPSVSEMVDCAHRILGLPRPGSSRGVPRSAET